MNRTKARMNAANPRLKLFRADETRPKGVMRRRWVAWGGALLALWLMPSLGQAQRRDAPELHFGTCEMPGDNTATIKYCSMTIDALAPARISKTVTISTYLES
jgi:hypothetical protein